MGHLGLRVVSPDVEPSVCDSCRWKLIVERTRRRNPLYSCATRALRLPPDRKRAVAIANLKKETLACRVPFSTSGTLPLCRRGRLLFEFATMDIKLPCATRLRPATKYRITEEGPVRRKARPPRNSVFRL